MQWFVAQVGSTLGPVKIELTKEVPELPSPGCAGGGRDETDFIKTLRMISPLLTAFWGRPITLEACVLLPWGWHDPAHADTKYPLVISHGHYSATWWTGGAFSETPAPANMSGYEKEQAEQAYALYREWTSPSGLFKGARALVVQVNHPNPFFDDSYAVNSANLGP